MDTNRVEVLGNLASISTILTFRDKSPEFSELGNAYAITSRDLVLSWPQSLSALQRILVSPDQESNALKDGDILLPARGTSYPARYCKVKGEIIFPVGQVYVVRPYDLLFGRYLTWYMNRPSFQLKLTREISGTTVMSLRKTTLLASEVEIPSFEIQRKIALINELDEERLLMRAEVDRLRKIECDTACETLFESP